jgi:hypothetical protein
MSQLPAYAWQCSKLNLKIKLRHHEEILGWFEAKRVDGDIYVSFPNKGWVKTRDLQDDDYFVEETQFISSPIAQVPSSGYHNHQFSKMSITWLEWLMEKEKRRGEYPIYIQHALNEGEYQVPNSKYKLDGFCRETNTAYEFNGCLWHGCCRRVILAQKNDE